jgi:WXG100 family type VII secretion target
MANVNVTYQDMTAAADRLVNGRQEIESMLSQLKRLVDDLVSAGYVTDSSSKQFQGSYEEFNTGATQTIAGLDGMGQYLKTAAQTFQDADTQLASALGR